MVKKSEVSKVMTALVKKRWAKTSKEERSKELSRVAKARWGKKGEEKHGER